jgi:HlyD family secretion protein
MAKRLGLALILTLAAGGAYYLTRPRATALVLTGIVTTDEIIVSPQIAGRIETLLVKEGESVKEKQLLAEIAPQELQAERAFFERSAEASSYQVQESEAALRLEEQRTAHAVEEAEANLASVIAQQGEARATLEDARIHFERQTRLSSEGVTPAQQLDEARAAYEVAKGRIEVLSRQADAQRAAVALAESAAEQVAVRRSQLQASRERQAAADAQEAQAGIRLAYARIESPLDGIVDVVAAQAGEVVTPGEAIVTLINPDNLWVRADVEETYIDRVRSGDTLTVRLPSGEERQGTVFYRAADAGFATQRDVSRTKRDIKTFEIRLRVDNADRRLALGMTVYVPFPESP